MRLWTLHPRYLDAKGLTATWREALLAQKVLQGATRGYRNHPQLQRFRESGDPLGAIAAFLAGVHAEAVDRGYKFNHELIANSPTMTHIEATHGQLMFEWGHLLVKLEERDRGRLWALQKIADPKPHPLFRIVTGGIADWERP